MTTDGYELLGKLVRWAVIVIWLGIIAFKLDAIIALLKK